MPISPDSSSDTDVDARADRSAAAGLSRQRPWRRLLEIGFWCLILSINGIGNSITTVIDLRREGSDTQDWEPFVWEGSSALVWLLVLVPMIVRFSRRFPIHWDTWRQYLPWHVTASLVASLIHVAGMVALRELAYAMEGVDYDFGVWSTEWLYEYLKDVRSYAVIVAVIELYRFLERRVQGEASLLDRPDEGDPVEPVDRPERFLVRKLGREFLIAANDIEWLQAAGNYVNLRVRGHDYPLRSTVAGIESRLDPTRFARIHRSYVVNLAQIASIEPLDDGDARIHLKDAIVLPCSRRYREPLRARASATA
ncbi:MAG: LytTR family transcriptional regulator [Lysobacter sp.]|nr:LytTR family transcriptional regulator [Lysobacter sp.]